MGQLKKLQKAVEKLRKSSKMPGEAFDLFSWCQVNGLSTEVATKLQVEDLDKDGLQDLTHDEMKELCPNMGQRKKLQKAVEKLRNSSKWQKQEEKCLETMEKSIYPVSSGDDNVAVACLPAVCSTTQSILALTPPDTIAKNENADPQTRLQDILELLALKEYFPSKISVAKVMAVSGKVTAKDKQLESAEVPWRMLERLIMMDSRARDWKGETISFCKDASSNNENIPDMIELHPLDIFYAVFLCCDLILQQLLAKKLFMCRLAIPFLIPLDQSIQCLMWPLKALSMEWRTLDGKAHDEFLVRHKMHIVSFLRIGRPSISKSQLLNDLLSDNTHDVFCNCESPNGMHEKQLTNGMVELSNYLPGGKDSDKFSKELIFCNLRGDSTLYQIQQDVLKMVSSVLVIIFDFEQCDQILETLNRYLKTQLSNTHIILLVTSKGCPSLINYNSLLKEFESYQSLNAISIYTGFFPGKRQKSLTEIKSSLQDALENVLKEFDHPRESFAFTTRNATALLDIMIDETTYLKQQEMETDLYTFFDKYTLQEIKMEMLPLQGKPWQEWAKLHKQLYRIPKPTDGQDILSTKEVIKQNMNDIRERQQVLCKELVPLMCRFIENIAYNVKNRTLIQCFMQNLKLNLDAMSKHVLPDLYAKYYEQWQTYNKHKMDRENVKFIRESLAATENDIGNATLGLEHLIREIGQIYEATSLNDQELPVNIGVEDLPSIPAHLLLYGFPFEIMDGDNSAIPLTWVTAVFESLLSIIGNKKLFVISVIGVQSSGKSTLLNTMFGLEFAVSAGRCTRGVYTQLIPVKEGSNLPFDYVLVLDTEGLRAPKLQYDKFENDNELATLTIGLADLTLVNLKGENTSEMQDILQIAVQAFLRMKIADKTKWRRCIFVHQNVPALNAKEKLLCDQQTLQESLDQMTKEAAQAENISGNISVFSDVIEFDCQKDIYYFSGLWNGDPPMAPVNHGYSERTQDIRVSIFNRISQNKQHSATLSDFIVQIGDMWDAILSDDFVFSFRNSLAIKAHITLEKKMLQLIHQLKSETVKWITNNVTINISSCKDLNTLKTESKHAVDKLTTRIHDQLQENVDNLNLFFDNTEFKTILCEVQENKIRQMRTEIAVYEKEMMKEIMDLHEKRSMMLKQKENQRQHEDQILDIVVDLAEKLRGQSLSDSEIHEEFEHMWSSSISIDISQVENVEHNPVKKEIEDILLYAFGCEGHRSDVLESIDSLETPRGYHRKLAGLIQIQDIEDGMVFELSRKAITNYEGCAPYEYKKNKATYKTYKKAVSCLNDMMSELQNIVDEICMEDAKFFKQHGERFVYGLLALFRQFNTGTKMITFHSRCQAKVAILASNVAMERFHYMNVQFERRHGYKAKMEEYKATMEAFFRSQLTHTSDIIATVDLFCSILQREITRLVNTDMSRTVVDIILQRFKYTKYDVMIAMLTELAIQEDFSRYIKYTENTYEFASTWIKHTSETDLFSRNAKTNKTKYAKHAKLNVTLFIGNVRKAAKYAIQMKKESKSGDRHWIMIFCNVLEAPVLKPSSFAVVMRSQINDYDNLLKKIDQCLTQLEELLHTEYDRVEKGSVNWEGNEPYRLIIDELWGCKAQCPFCGEVCMSTKQNHTEAHRCIQHRMGAFAVWQATGSNKLYTDCCSWLIAMNKKFECLSMRCSCRKDSSDNKKREHRYKKYKQYYPTWDIAPDSIGSASRYWKWVLCKFNEQIAMYHKVRPASIPNPWKMFTKVNAINSLDFL